MSTEAETIHQLEADLAASREEVERWKSTLDAVLTETAKELGCEPDNEAILAAAAASREEAGRWSEKAIAVAVERNHLRRALEAVRGWIEHWQRDAEANLRPTDESMSRALAVIAKAEGR